MPSRCMITWSLCRLRPPWRTNVVGSIWLSHGNACSVLVPPVGGRSCMRSGEYQLSPEHIILERAAAERSRRRQRQVSSQSSSQQSEPSVSSIAFVAEQRVCCKRSKPIRSVSWSFFHPWGVSCGCAAFRKALTRSMKATRPL